MVKNYTNEEFISEFSYERYMQIVEIVFENMKQIPGFKNNNKPTVRSMMCFDLKYESGKMETLIIEANAYKKEIFSDIKAYDFCITKIAISDEDMPD